MKILALLRDVDPQASLAADSASSLDRESYGVRRTWWRQIDICWTPGDVWGAGLVESEEVDFSTGRGEGRHGESSEGMAWWKHRGGEDGSTQPDKDGGREGYGEGAEEGKTEHRHWEDHAALGQAGSGAANRGGGVRCAEQSKCCATNPGLRPA